jgi:hypothetical protein
MDEPLAGEAYAMEIGLYSFASPGTFQVNPTITAGDFTLYRNGVLMGNLATLPVVRPAGGSVVYLVLAAQEVVSPLTLIQGHDPDAEWGDIQIPLHPREAVAVRPPVDPLSLWKI